MGLLGDDSGAQGLRSILTGNRAHIEGLLPDRGRPTISKTRVIAGGRATVSQQIVRIDKESKEPVSQEMEAALLSYIESILPQMQGIVLSDYGAGTITEPIKEHLIAYARRCGIPSFVDSRYDIRRFRGIGFVKQNDSELATALGRDLPDEAALELAGKELLREMDADGVLVTRGEQGMSLFERDGMLHHIPVTDRSEVFDVSGAGDSGGFGISGRRPAEDRNGDIQLRGRHRGQKAGDQYGQRGRIAKNAGDVKCPVQETMSVWQNSCL